MWVIRLRTLYVCIERSIGVDLIIGEVLLKNLPSSTLSLQMYSWEHICNELYNSLWFQNPFIKTSAILLCYSSTSYRWSTRIMSFNRLNPSLHIWGTLARESPCAQLLRNYTNILWSYSCPCCYQAGYRSFYCPIPCTKESLNVMTTKHICSVWLWTTQFTLRICVKLFRKIIKPKFLWEIVYLQNFVNSTQNQSKKLPSFNP